MENNTNTNTTAQTFRVQVAATRNGMRLRGHSRRVQAANKAEAAEVACAQAATNDAARVAAFNVDCDRFGTTAQTALTDWKAEKVRRFASDNR